MHVQEDDCFLKDPFSPSLGELMDRQQSSNADMKTIESGFNMMSVVFTVMDDVALRTLFVQISVEELPCWCKMYKRPFKLVALPRIISMSCALVTSAKYLMKVLSSAHLLLSISALGDGYRLTGFQFKQLHL